MHDDEHFMLKFVHDDSEQISMKWFLPQTLSDVVDELVKLASTPDEMLCTFTVHFVSNLEELIPIELDLERYEKVMEQEIAERVSVTRPLIMNMP